MTPIEQSFHTNVELLAETFSTPFQAACENITNTITAGFKPSSIAKICSGITDAVASNSRVDLACRGVFFALGTVSISASLYEARRAYSAKTWTGTFFHAAHALVPLACGAFLTKMAIFYPFDPLPFVSDSAHDRLLGSLPH